VLAVIDRPVTEMPSVLDIIVTRSYKQSDPEHLRYETMRLGHWMESTGNLILCMPGASLTDKTFPC
jgi:hypothetical protein